MSFLEDNMFTLVAARPSKRCRVILGVTTLSVLYHYRTAVGLSSSSTPQSGKAYQEVRGRVA